MITIMRGVPGSGKSTWVSKNRPKAVVCSADHFFMESGVYKFDASRLGEAHAQCLRDFLRFLTIENRPYHGGIVVDNTNSTAVEMAPYVALALAFETPLEIVQISCDLDKAAARNIHGVPAGAIRAMNQRLIQPLPPFWPKSISIQES